jgi:SOS-response transcriptional repressor LexA
MTSAALAKAIHYDPAVVENVVNGGGKMSEKMAALIENVTDGEITKEIMLGGSESPRIMEETGFYGTVGTLSPNAGKRYIPLLSWARAGAISDATAFDEDYQGDGIETDIPGRAFAVIIEGDSMSPEISPGAKAVVRADRAPRPGSLVIVRTIEGEVFCKRYTIEDNGRTYVLYSVNRIYPEMRIPASDIAWIYPVKQVIRNYD